MPAITLSPTSGNPGITVTVKGTGFAKKQKIKMRIDPPQGAVKSYTTTNTGTFTGTVVTGSASSLGLHTVTVTPFTGTTVLATGTFTLVAAKKTRFATGIAAFKVKPAVVPPTGPTILAGPTISNITSTTASATWTLSEPCTGRVQYGMTTVYGQLTTEETSFDYSTHNQTISGLVAGTLYHARVVGKNQAGLTYTSNDVTFTTLGVVVPPPGVPTNFTAVSADRKVTLSWGVVSMATSYKVYRDGSLLATTPNSLYQDTGLTNGQTYTYQVSAVINGVEGAKAGPLVATPSAVIPPTTPDNGIYGSAIETDGKDNRPVGRSIGEQVGIRWTTAGGTVTGIAVNQRAGENRSNNQLGYSYGSGGVWLITLEGVNSAGMPNGTVYITKTYTPSNPCSGTFEPSSCGSEDRSTIPVTPTAIAAGTYVWVFKNIHADPVLNWMSLNMIYSDAPQNPRQPAYPDNATAVLLKTGSGAWGVYSSNTPVFDVTFSGGAHEGQAYYSIIANTDLGSGGASSGFTLQSGTSVRQTFTPSSTIYTNAVWIRCQRLGGTGTITATVNSVSGSAAIAGLPLVAKSNLNGGRWVKVGFPTAVTLSSGVAQNVAFTTNSTLNIMPIRDAADPDGNPSWASRAFRDGKAEKNTGSGWSNLYNDYTDLQFYFDIVPEPPTPGTFPTEYSTIQSRALNSDAMPGYLSTIVDSTWGTHITRITNVNGYRNNYSGHQSWNLDGTRMMFPGYGGRILNGTTYADLGAMNAWAAFPCWSNTNADYAYGVRYDSNKVRRYSVSANAWTDLHTFSSYSYLDLGGYAGNVAGNDRIAFMYYTGSDIGVVVYNAATDTVISSRSFGIGDALTTSLMSWSGNYVAVGHGSNGTGANQGTWLYNAADMSTVRQLSAGRPHADFAQNASGQDIFVQCAIADDPGPGNGGYVTSHRCSDGLIINLNQLWDWFSVGHISGTNYDRPGWVYVSNGAWNGGGPGPGIHQVAALKTDGSQDNEVFAFHHNGADTNYDSQPFFSAYRDGTKGVFGGKWGGSNTYSFVAKA